MKYSLHLDLEALAVAVELGGVQTLDAGDAAPCVPGITVVNIDNGFSAGVAAAMINRTGERSA